MPTTLPPSPCCRCATQLPQTTCMPPVLTGLAQAGLYIHSLCADIFFLRYCEDKDPFCRPLHACIFQLSYSKLLSSANHMSCVHDIAHAGLQLHHNAPGSGMNAGQWQTRNMPIIEMHRPISGCCRVALQLLHELMPSSRERCMLTSSAHHSATQQVLQQSTHASAHVQTQSRPKAVHT